MPRGTNSQVRCAFPDFAVLPQTHTYATAPRAMQGNTYNTPGGTNSQEGTSYHYSNTDGSYYYKNDNGSTYHDNGRGGSTYTSPSGARYTRGSK